MALTTDHTLAKLKQIGIQTAATAVVEQALTNVVIEPRKTTKGKVMPHGKNALKYNFPAFNQELNDLLQRYQIDNASVRSINACVAKLVKKFQ